MVVLIISIIAQNYGAGNYERIKESYYTAIKYALFIMILSGILIFITSGIIPTFFSDNLEVNHFGKKYLQISAFVLPAYPIRYNPNPKKSIKISHKICCNIKSNNW